MINSRQFSLPALCLVLFLDGIQVARSTQPYPRSPVITGDASSPSQSGPGPSIPSWFPKAPPWPPATGEVLRVSTSAELFAAVERLLQGGTILLADGHYQLPRPIVLDQKKDIAFRSASGDPAKVTLSGKGWERGDEHDDLIHIRRCDGVLIADLTFADCRSYGVKVQAEDAPRDIHVCNCRFRDIGVRAIKGSAGQDPAIHAVKGSVRGCYFENTKVPPANWLFGGDYISAIDMMALEDWTFSGNVFRNINGRNGGARAAIFIWVRSKNVVVERNLIVNCDRGIAFGNPGQSTANIAGRPLAYVTDGMIRNNFITGGPDCGIELWYAEKIQVLNNTIWRPQQNWQRGIRVGTGTTEAEIVNNLVHGEILLEGGQAHLDHNLAARLDNYFVDPAAGDLSLTPGATGALRQGISLKTATDDIRQHRRPDHPDLGAWQTDQSKSASAGTTIEINLDREYYQLPRWCVGAKMTAYASDYAGGDFPSDPKRAQRTTPDGKTWIECIQEMKLGFIGASMVQQGRPPTKASPIPTTTTGAWPPMSW